MDWHEVLDDHIHQLQLPHNRSVFLLELLPFLDHELLDVVVSLVGQLQLVIDLRKLLLSMLDLLLQGHVQSSYILDI